MRHHNPLCQRGIGPSLTCRVEILLDKDLRQSLQFPVTLRVAMLGERLKKEPRMNTNRHE